MRSSPLMKERERERFSGGNLDSAYCPVSLGSVSK